MLVLSPIRFPASRPQWRSPLSGSTGGKLNFVRRASPSVAPDAREFPRQESARQRTPRQQPHLLIHQHRDDFPLQIPSRDRIIRLHVDKFLQILTLRDPQTTSSPATPPDSSIRYTAPSPPHQAIHRAQRFFKRRQLDRTRGSDTGRYNPSPAVQTFLGLPHDMQPRKPGFIRPRRPCARKLWWPAPRLAASRPAPCRVIVSDSPAA